MKWLWFIPCFACHFLVLAEEPVQPSADRACSRKPMPPKAWLGLEVSKPDDSITAHLPDLPPGIGFVVRSIEKDGPAELAGIREFDVIWKLGEQMLVNESQLAALLRLSKPGDEVVFHAFRGGKPLELKLVLGVSPERKVVASADLLDQAILPGECQGPMRVVNFSEKVASYSNDEGRIELRRDGVGYKVLIQGPSNEIVYQGDVAADGNADAVPEAWRRRLQALRRGLDHQIDGRYAPTRQARPRVVAPAEPKP